MGKEKSITEHPVHSCPGKIEIPTRKEQQALAELRKIKQKVRETKALLKELKASSKGENQKKIDQLESELGSLKEQWDMWEMCREVAAKERMIILGHTEPETE